MSGATPTSGAYWPRSGPRQRRRWGSSATGRWPPRPNRPGTMGTADLHLHTAYSDGLPSVPELLDYVEHATGLDVIAITDHDDLRACAEAQELAARRGYRFQVVPGVEVTSSEGHLLALFVEGPIPPWRSLAETVATVQAQGGLCIIPHPFSWLTQSVGQRGLERLLSTPGPRPVGIEVANPSPAGAVTAARVREWSLRQLLAESGGSDAHFLGAVGRACTAFPGRTAAELRQALLARQTQALLRPAGYGRGVTLGERVRQALRAHVLRPGLPIALWRHYGGSLRP
ncbi:MAG: PHP domain-containing protein [Dehalococcoidia bacterium]|nr:PHP domain-containing protein [Dehalococcoidia bacterium]